ncbi:SIS domain-containing protein [Parasphingorhabdus sp.]|uniref:D-sedoheptulose-7-phosphate isomerase n=1 Tax=Parasphingorhabdus sp. TaxID=2709688 RepID=UPI0032EF27B3
MKYLAINDLCERYPSLKSCCDDLSAASDLLIDTFRNSGKLLVAGNGGSASDADHICGELLKGFMSARKISGADRELLGDGLADELQGGLPAIPLPQMSGFHTAFCNDCDPLYVFAQGVWALGNKGDVFLAISTSGNSKNVLHAVEVAKRKGMKVIGLTGSGGALRQQADIAISAPAKEVHLIQEYHLPLYHALCVAVEEVLFPG